MGKKRQPWHKRPSETMKAYGAFTIYVELGPERTITDAHNVQRKAKGLSPLAKEGSWWTRWSMEHSWVDRAQAYDEWAFDQRLKKAERARDCAYAKILAKTEEVACVLLDMACGNLEEVNGYNQLKAVLAALAIAGLTAVKSGGTNVEVNTQVLQPIQTMTPEMMQRLVTNPDVQEHLRAIALEQQKLLTSGRVIDVEVEE